MLIVRIVVHNRLVVHNWCQQNVLNARYALMINEICYWPQRLVDNIPACSTRLLRIIRITGDWESWGQSANPGLPVKTANSAFHPSGLGKSSTNLWLELRRVVFTCVGWQVSLYDPILQVAPHCSDGVSLRVLLFLTLSYVCDVRLARPTVTVWVQRQLHHIMLNNSVYGCSVN